MNKQVREAIVEFSLKCMRNVGWDHNFDHVERVRLLSLAIAEDEQGINKDILETACYLHDISHGSKIDHALAGAEESKKFLMSLGLSNTFIDGVYHCILAHRYRTDYPPKTIEAKILFDADKLDGLGAIGIVRGSMWLGKHGADPFREYYSDYVKENQSGRIDGRIIDKSKHSLFIDYEVKGKLLPEKMYTTKGKKIARDRARFYKLVLDRIEEEKIGEK